MGDSFFVDLALKEAWKFQLLTYPNPAVGAVVIENGKILSIEAHQRAGTSHAEVRALVRAYEKKSSKRVDFDISDAKASHDFLLSLDRDFFKDFEIFLTLEPCSHSGKTPSCASLLSELKLRRVVISTLDPIKNHSGGVEILKSSGVEVELGVEEKRAKELIEPFVIWQERAFVVFKLAQSLNGRIGGGYLSSKESLTHTHKIREVIDMLIIGGNTVRTDRPTLDCRFSNPSKAPNVTIFSKKGSFEPDIPLFGVKNREVRVTQSLDFSKPSLVLVEGGEGLLNSLKSSIDWSLHYITPQLSSNQISYNCTQKLTFLHQERVGVDFILWSRFEQ